MHRNSSTDQAVRARALTCLRGTSLKCYCPFLHLFYSYFATVAELRHGASAHDCDAFPSLLKSARDRSSVWEIRFDPADRAERRHADRVPSWEERSRLCQGPLRVFLSRCSTSMDPRGRTIRGWRPMIAKNRATLKECDYRNANVRLNDETFFPSDWITPKINPNRPFPGAAASACKFPSGEEHSRHIYKAIGLFSTSYFSIIIPVLYFDIIH